MENAFFASPNPDFWRNPGGRDEEVIRVEYCNLKAASREGWYCLIGFWTCCGVCFFFPGVAVLCILCPFLLCVLYGCCVLAAYFKVTWYEENARTRILVTSEHFVYQYGAHSGALTEEVAIPLNHITKIQIRPHWELLGYDSLYMESPLFPETPERHFLLNDCEGVRALLVHLRREKKRLRRAAEAARRRTATAAEDDTSSEDEGVHPADVEGGEGETYGGYYAAFFASSSNSSVGDEQTEDLGVVVGCEEGAGIDLERGLPELAGVC